MSRSPTVRELARLIGVHHSTVSRALRDDPALPQATRNRIKQIAAEQGYELNPFVSAWMAARRAPLPGSVAPTIAYVICIPDPAVWQSTPSIYRFYLGAKERARELGFNLEEFPLCPRKMSASRLNQMLDARGVRGVIVGSAGTSHAHLKLDWRRYAAVAQGLTLKKPELSRTANNYSGSMTLALRELRKLGYSRIGYVTMPQIDARVAGGWTSAFLYYQTKVAKADRVPELFWDDTEKSLLRWHDKHAPQAIITHDAAVRRVLEHHGIRAPRDVGLANIDWDPSLDGWAGVDYCVENAGAIAADLVVEQLLRNEYGVPKVAKTVLTDGRWVKGPSVRRLGPVVPLKPLTRDTRLLAPREAHLYGAAREARVAAS